MEIIYGIVGLMIMILGFVLGQLLPRLWEWKRYKIEREKNRRGQVREFSELRDKIEDKLVSLINLQNELRKAENSKAKKQVQAQIDLTRDDLFRLEDSLAKLEQRKPRDLIKALRPLPVTDPRVIMTEENGSQHEILPKKSK
jgi:uncharacterized membrane protein YhiD involved in acid resistance